MLGPLPEITFKWKHEQRHSCFMPTTPRPPSAAGPFDIGMLPHMGPRIQEQVVPHKSYHTALQLRVITAIVFERAVEFLRGAGQALHSFTVFISPSLVNVLPFVQYFFLEGFRLSTLNRDAGQDPFYPSIEKFQHRKFLAKIVDKGYIPSLALFIVPEPNVSWLAAPLLK